MGNRPTDVDVDAVAEATVAKYRELQKRFAEVTERRLAALKTAEELEKEQHRIGEQARQCHQTGILFGFDLGALLERPSSSPMHRQLELPPPPPHRPKFPTVKSFVLDAAREAFPASVRAADLRRAILNHLGLELHEKTVGMTLYRLSKEGFITRNGIDWFFNPNASRAANEDDEEPPPDFDEAEEEAAG